MPNGSKRPVDLVRMLKRAKSTAQICATVCLPGFGFHGAPCSDHGVGPIPCKLQQEATQVAFVCDVPCVSRDIASFRASYRGFKHII